MSYAHREMRGTVIPMNYEPLKRISRKTPQKIGDNPEENQKPWKDKRISFWIGALVVVFLLSGRTGGQGEAGGPKDKGESVAYSELLTYEKDQVKEAWVYSGKDRIVLTTQDGRTVNAYYPAGGDAEAYERLEATGAKVTVIAVKPPGLLTSLLLSVLPILLVVGFIIYMSKKGAGSILSQIRQKNNPVKIPETRFNDVAGVDDVVSDLKEIVEFLDNPDRYKNTGAKSPRGFLLTGPPGTGKTLLARAVAGEAGVPFYAITGSDFVEMFVGVGAARVRELFKKAREETKAIVFIDEIDAIGKSRSKGAILGSNDERENTLNALLVELDGFIRHSGIVVLAATNRADVLDPALLRPGRFDKIIAVRPPDRQGRARIMELYAKNRPFETGIDWMAIAKRVPGLTGAQIEQLLNESALEAVRAASATITKEHIESALATTMLGRERKSSIISERDRRIVAWHEAGHTVAALLLKDADKPVQVSIIPRGATGGSTWMSGSDHDLTTKNQMLARLTVSLSGRAAEEIHLDGDYTQGAHGDILDATNLATAMVTKFGMGKKLSAVSEERLVFDGPVGADVNDEVDQLLGDLLEQSRDLLRRNIDMLRCVAEELMDKETLDTQDIERIEKMHNVA